MASTITAERRPTAERGRAAQTSELLAGLAALPSLWEMTPAEARAAQVLGKPWDTAEIVELAIAWVGTGLDVPTLTDLAGRDWDDPVLPTLFDIVLDDLGAGRPASSTARRRVAAYLARRAVAHVPAPRRTG
ncbi:hypothetical protein [Actinomycetospora callitridis]|uniref:hypothetical protein n=1 Tax=Actinomycetospora callitridis TaxID=913944 RepID=UPI002366F83F|nr:hypothetical protein [Actinomycetospora callitridis]MDD7917695.1 hypothetical protein [Actinomycetospora callitridis]